MELVRIWRYVCRDLSLVLVCICAAAGCARPATPSNEPARAAAPASTRPSAQCSSVEECEQQCDAKQSHGCLALAYLLETGRGAPQSYEKAGAVYALACTLAAVEACTHLGMMNDVGLIGGASPARALELYERACELGDGWACRRATQLKPR